MSGRARSKPEAGGRGGREPRRPGSDALPATTPFVERASLLILLALIPLRVVLAETHRFSTPSFFRGQEGPPSAQPATTFLIIGLICAVALVSAFARLWRGRPLYRRTGAEIGAALLMIAGVVSTWRASQTHLALIGTLDLLGMILFMFALRQLLTRPWHVRLALSVIVATGAMVGVKAVYQVAVEYPDTQAYFEQYHQARLQAQAGEAGVGQLHDFERRLEGRLATSYFSHPNVFGSHVILFVCASIAVVADRFRRRAHWTLALPLLVAAGGGATLWLAQSKGALAALAGAAALFALGHLLAGRIRRRPRATVIGLWLLAVIGAAGIAGLLRARPEALGRSMLFRQLYWQGAWSMVQEQGPWGVGANNFGRWFTRYKPVDCPEEVQAPHSWIVRLAAEWGALGLMGMVFMFAGISRRLWRSPDPPAPHAERGGSIGLWALGIALVLAAGWAVILAGADSDFLMWTLLMAVPVWIVAFGVNSMESRRAGDLPDDGLGPILAGLCAGLLGFLLHTSIDLAMFTPAAATTFFAMMGVALAVRGGFPTIDERPARRGPAIVLALMGAVVLGFFAAGIVAPAAETAARLDTARRGATEGGWDRFVASRSRADYVAAAAAYRPDATASVELSEALIGRLPAPGAIEPRSALERTDRILDLLEGVRRRDPRNSSLNRNESTVHYQRYEHTRRAAELDRAIEAMRRSVAGYPTAPKRWIVLGQLIEARIGDAGSPDDRRDAANAYRRALLLDDGRIHVSTPNRLSQAQRADLGERIERLASPRAASGPASPD